MILTWRQMKITIVLITMGVMIRSEESYRPPHWKMIEHLAETRPYIVGLLNENKNYTCTGTIIDKQTVLTSGSCLIPQPKYIVVGVAIYCSKVHASNIFPVAYTILHGDYTFELKASNPNVTKMHSNIGLAISKRPVLDIYIPLPIIGNYFASELKNKKLVVTGFGNTRDVDVVVLQQQAYHQTPCANPKWYYCVCGIEYSAYTKAYNKEFGKGAPVMIDAGVVGITATPCGLLVLKSVGIKYNIFTVIGPYLPWIQKNEINSTLSFRSFNNGVIAKDNLFKYYVFVVAVSKVFN